MKDAYILDGVRTPIGRHQGALASARPDDLAGHVIRALMQRQPNVDFLKTDEVIMGCTNQAGEDSRNIARVALLLSGLPVDVPGITLNRLCASGLEAVADAARRIKTGDASLVIAGGVESMSRAPVIVPKAQGSTATQGYDSTLGWRFINPEFHMRFGTDSMPETAEIVAEERKISRQDQDAFACRSQARVKASRAAGYFKDEIVPTPSAGKIVAEDEHPRPNTTLSALAALPTPFREHGTVTAGNASGINDGAAALAIVSRECLTAAAARPLARVVATTAMGVPPRIMGLGPVPAVQKILATTSLTLDAIDVLEINEAFAAQVLACLRELGIADDDPRVNINGGAIALGHPLGMSGARLVLTAARELQRREGRYALVTMCVGVGQGVAMLLERS